MKEWRDSSFRTKLCVSNVIAIMLVVAAIVLLMTMTASRETAASNRAYLDILTEQALGGFTDTLRNMDQSLYSLCNGIGVPEILFNMRGMTPESPGYPAARRELTGLLSMMTTSSMPYDRVALLPDGENEPILGANFDRASVMEAESVFAAPESRANTYGRRIWLKLENGSLWEVWDVYHVSPLRHVARLAGRVLANSVISAEWATKPKDLSILFLNDSGDVLFEIGTPNAELISSLPGLMEGSPDMCTCQGAAYAMTVKKSGEWTAVGFQPLSVINGVSRHLGRIATMALFIGVVLAVCSAAFFSKGMSGRIGTLLDSMKEVAGGNLEVVVPVESSDEIGLISAHFNQMTQQTKELLGRIVQEEGSKQRAEYQNLEYEYRFLQWQINPHFIYNTLESINALAKLDGNDELCEMIQTLSGYFRQNAENMRKRFVTVRQELRSVRRYVDIYRLIYGSDLNVTYEYDEEAGRAYLPTMIVQPLLENALIHGVVPGQAENIRIRAVAAGDRLQVHIEDNGPGMPQEMIRRLMDPDHALPESQEEKTSLGIRNVLERLALLFGREASLTIESELGKGTHVCMSLPLSTEEFPDTLAHFQKPDER